ncbi:restriction endonuclease subunit S [Bacillus cereus]|uniref:Restriction endonuclease subunit S n=1 Tax=Bacillus cereus TaxID=1396 RepID=A0ABD7DQL5_BACCE|nr:restriction endonuclease subunit S [Bacillus cereus]QRY18695.1 restriction endonuclease subunit S [Bacillus cereus]
MVKNNHTPDIRFPRFSGDWEQRKLKEIVERVTRKNTNLESTLPLTISAQYGLVDQVTFFNKQVASKDVSNYYLLKNGEFAYNKSYSNGYPWGAVKRLDRYDMGVLSTLYITFKPTLINSDYLVSYYDTTQWHKEVSMRAAEGARNHGLLNISASEFFDTNLKVPNKEEQIKIGNFFKQLDDTIALHQQELTTLKQTKQGFLQKMFPKEGEFVPEIRFPGFTGDWEQRTLGEMSESFEYGLNASATEYDGENKYIRITDIDDNTHEFLEEKLTSPNIDLSSAENYLVKEGDILFARTGASVGKSYIYDKKDGKMYYAGFLIRARIKSGYDPGFIFQNTLTSKYNKFIKVTSQRSGQPGVNAQEYANFSLMAPNNDEQIKIGNFFKQLDDTISLHQRELEALKEMKKAFLQKMFV